MATKLSKVQRYELEQLREYGDMSYAARHKTNTLAALAQRGFVTLAPMMYGGYHVHLTAAGRAAIGAEPVSQPSAQDDSVPVTSDQTPAPDNVNLIPDDPIGTCPNCGAKAVKRTTYPFGYKSMPLVVYDCQRCADHADLPPVARRVDRLEDELAAANAEIARLNAELNTATNRLRVKMVTLQEANDLLDKWHDTTAVTWSHGEVCEAHDLIKAALGLRESSR